MGAGKWVRSAGRVRCQVPGDFQGTLGPLRLFLGDGPEDRVVPILPLVGSLLSSVATLDPAPFDRAMR